MKDRIIVPTDTQQGLDAPLAQHFGRAPYYAVVELDNNGEITSVKTVPNIGEHAGVAVLKANANTVGEVVASFKDDELVELTEGCEHAHHQAEHEHHH